MPLNIAKYEDILKQIDWEHIRSRIVKHAKLNETEQRIFERQLNKAEIESKFRLTQKLIDFTEQETYNTIKTELVEFDSEFPFFKKLDDIKKFINLSLPEINQFVLGLEFFIYNLASLEENVFDKHSFHANNDDFIAIKRLIIKPFRIFVDIEGEVHLEKHPLLKSLFYNLNALEDKIREKIEKIAKSEDFQNNLQFSEHDILNDYYVLAIKSDHYKNSLGKIIGKSDTGKTLYVEPKGLSALNQERMDIVLEISRIINTIEKDYIEKLTAWMPVLERSIQFIHLVDEVNTRAQFALTENLFPAQVGDKAIISLKGAWHPLIENPVKNDYDFNNKNGLIISGPNTGGKTASLKTIGLCVLMMKYGFFVPAREATLYPFEAVHFLGNDLQNISEGLSSFAAEVKSYQELLEELGGSNVILIDEIFNSTSSEEASALAYALLRFLIQKPNTLAVVSTHHQTLKQFLHQDDNFFSAHVGFDEKTNEPTYKVHYGLPGSSHALDIFEKFSKENKDLKLIYEQSKNYLDSKMVHLERLLSEISQKENHLNKKLSEVSKLEKELKNQKDANKALYKIKLEEMIFKAKQKINTTQAEADQILLDIHQGKRSNKNKVASQFSELKQNLSEIQPKKQEKNTSTPSQVPKEVKIGEYYYCTAIDKNVEVLKIHKGKVKVKTGKIKLEVKLNQLRIDQSSQQKKTPEPIININSNPTSSIEYDCRGMRLSEFQSLVESTLSDLYTNEVPFINFIHGHGSGTLKKWIRNFIKSHPDFSVQSSETGNDGETKIILA